MQGQELSTDIPCVMLVLPAAKAMHSFATAEGVQAVLRAVHGAFGDVSLCLAFVGFERHLINTQRREHDAYVRKGTCPMSRRVIARLHCHARDYCCHSGTGTSFTTTAHVAPSCAHCVERQAAWARAGVPIANKDIQARCKAQLARSIFRFQGVTYRDCHDEAQLAEHVIAMSRAIAEQPYKARCARVSCMAAAAAAAAAGSCVLHCDSVRVLVSACVSE
jgi:hypothetical protein